MTACTCPTCTDNLRVWNAAAERIASGAPAKYDPVAALDKPTLVRSFGFGKTARREQRRPVQLRVDEYGWGNDGRYYSSQDGAA